MESKENNFDENNPWWKPAMFFYAKVTSWIIFPIVAVMLFSKYVSGVNNLVFFVLMIGGFVVTCFGIYKEIKIYKKNLN